MIGSDLFLPSYFTNLSLGRGIVHRQKKENQLEDGASNKVF